MERPVKGDVVVIPFPFSDLSASKRRPPLTVLSIVTKLLKYTLTDKIKNRKAEMLYTGLGHLSVV